LSTRSRPAARQYYIRDLKTVAGAAQNSPW
jgi:hypothetical protein